MAEHDAALPWDAIFPHGVGGWIDHLPEAVLLAQDGLVIYANETAGEMFAAQARGTLYQVPLTRLLLGEIRPGGDHTARRLDGREFAAELKLQATMVAGREAILHVVRNVDHERGLEKRLGEKQAEIHRLAGRLLETQERERRHIARELHDEIGQCLSAIRVQFAKLQRRTEAPEALALIESAAALTERTLGRVRSLSLLLHPPQLETLGLGAALQWHVREQAQLHDWSIGFEGRQLRREPHPDVAIAVYRILQESLSNARRHGHAQHVMVELAGDEERINLRIVDDGRGFDMNRINPDQALPTLGLIGMAERARLLGGTFHIASAPDKGTRVCAAFPSKW